MSRALLSVSSSHTAAPLTMAQAVALADEFVSERNRIYVTFKERDVTWESFFVLGESPFLGPLLKRAIAATSNYILTHWNRRRLRLAFALTASHEQLLWSAFIKATQQPGYTQLTDAQQRTRIAEVLVHASQHAAVTKKQRE